MKELKARDYVLIGESGYVVDWVSPQPFQTSRKYRLRKVGIAWWLSWLTWLSRTIVTDKDFRRIERVHEVKVLPHQDMLPVT